MKLADKYRKLGIRTNADQPDQVDNADRLRRRRHRPVPHRAHVLRRRPHHRGAGDDPGRQRGRSQEGAGQAAAASAERFRRHLPRPERPAGVHPLARSAAARIPAAARQPEAASRKWPSSSASPSKRSTKRVHELHEFNPMLGFRGCRLGIKYPGNHRDAGPGHLPGRGGRAEGRHQGQAGSHDSAGRLQEANSICKSRSSTASPSEVMKETGKKFKYTRRHDDRSAARRADGRRNRRDGRVLQLRHQRPDADVPRHEPRRFSGSFLPAYQQAEIIKANPFASIDTDRRRPTDARSASRRAATTRPDLKIGICGEHGGDPSSIVMFCHKIGLNYVSCSPFRVPIARLAAAQAALKDAK